VTISGIRRDITSTYTIVSDIQRNMLEIQKGADSQNQWVSNTCPLSIAEQALNIVA